METKLQQRHAASLAALRAVMAMSKMRGTVHSELPKQRRDFIRQFGWPILKGGN